MNGKELVEEIVRAAEERGRYLQLRDLQIGAATTRSEKARLDRLADAIAGLIDAGLRSNNQLGDTHDVDSEGCCACGAYRFCNDALARCEAAMKEGR